MAAPTVYSAITAVATELASTGIAKTHLNLVDQYNYRSIDDLLCRLSPLLAKHRLCVLPRVLERTETQRAGLGDELLLHVVLRMAFDLVSVDDGSSHRLEGFGEALDHGDKGTAKAMSAAYKAAMLQAFCIPVSAEDADASSPRLKRISLMQEPVEGWEAWVRDMCDVIAVCESPQALRLLQQRHQQLLQALSAAQPALYEQLGECFGARKQALLTSTQSGSSRREKRQPKKAQVKETERA